MKKVVIKEFDREILAIDIALYFIYIMFGLSLLSISKNGINNLTPHASYLFFTLAFFSIFAYFLNRRKNNYEFLILGFINVYVGAYCQIYNTYPDVALIMANAVVLYSISCLLNKGVSCKRLLNEENLDYFFKLVVTFLIVFLGIFVGFSLYSKIDAGIMIISYYFIVFGLLSLLEPLFSIVINNKSVNKYVSNYISFPDNQKEVITKKKKTQASNDKPKAKIKNRTIKKINKK